MDSKLETFAKKHRKATAAAKATSVAQQKHKQFAKATALANDVVKRRESLEARSNLYNRGPMYHSGTGVKSQTTEGHFLSEKVPTIHPGLQQMRAHEIKRRAPTTEEYKSAEMGRIRGGLPAVRTPVIDLSDEETPPARTVAAERLRGGLRTKFKTSFKRIKAALQKRK
jgi:hypothetical protein